MGDEQRRAMSEKDRDRDGNLVPAGCRDMTPVASANPLVSRGIADVALIATTADLVIGPNSRFLDQVPDEKPKLSKSQERVLAKLADIRRRRANLAALMRKKADQARRTLEQSQGNSIPPPDATPLTLWIKATGGIMAVLIPRNTAIPIQQSRSFTTSADNQPSIEIEMYMGERTTAKENRCIGSFHLGGIPPAPAGDPQIEVAFQLDIYGVMNVTGKDQGTGKQLSVRSECSGGLSQDDIDDELKRATSPGTA
jgi:hypothetical protein